MGCADLHIHSTWSDGLLNPHMILNYLAVLNIEYNRKYGRNYLDVIAITDHDEVAGAYEARDYSRHFRLGIDVLIGAEVSTLDGHVVALDIEQNISPGKSAAWTVDAIHEQGGLAVAAHPYTPSYLFLMLPFMKQLRGVGSLLKELDFDAVETVNANITELIIGNNMNKRVNRKFRQLPELGSSDAHFISAFEKAYTRFPGHSKEDFLAAVKHGKTTAHGRVWSPFDLVRFLHDKYRLHKVCKEKGILPHHL